MSSNNIVKFCKKFNYRLNYPEHFNCINNENEDVLFYLQNLDIQ